MCRWCHVWSGVRCRAVPGRFSGAESAGLKVDSERGFLGCLTPLTDLVGEFGNGIDD